MRSHCRKLGGLVMFGCGLLVIWQGQSALGQSDSYDPSSRTQIRYGMGRDTAAGSQDGASAPANSDDLAKPTWKPKRTYESPRAGSPNYGTTAPTQPSGDDTSRDKDSTTPARPPRRTARGDVVRSSYTPSNDSADSGSYYPPSSARTRRQPGMVDNVAREFGPAESNSTYNNSYGYRPHHARLAMADQGMTPTPSSSPPMGSVMHGGGEEMPHGAPMGPPLSHGDMINEGEWSDGSGPPQGDCESCGSGGSCGDCCCRPLCCLFCCDFWDEWGQDLSFFAGTQAFKGPVDQGFNGDFGFHEGLNWGSPLWDAAGIGAQIGVNVVESDLSRTNATDMHRDQTFFTAGLFHRPECSCGWQGGLVWDYLNDSFVDNFTISQLRGDLSYVFNCHEIGFWYTVGVSDKKLVSVVDETRIVTTRYKAIDLYAFYYGHKFCNGGEGRIWGGFTGGTGGLVGADFSVPICSKLSIDSGFNYAIPHHTSGEDVPPEGWNLGITLVFHPFSCSHSSYCSPYRPLFNVADNGSFMVDRQVTTQTRAVGTDGG